MLPFLFLALTIEEFIPLLILLCVSICQPSFAGP